MIPPIHQAGHSSLEKALFCHGIHLATSHRRGIPIVEQDISYFNPRNKVCR